MGDHIRLNDRIRYRLSNGVGNGPFLLPAFFGFFVNLRRDAIQFNTVLAHDLDKAVMDPVVERRNATKVKIAFRRIKFQNIVIRGIADLEGIHHFQCVTILRCWEHRFIEIDFPILARMAGNNNGSFTSIGKRLQLDIDGRRHRLGGVNQFRVILFTEVGGLI